MNTNLMTNKSTIIDTYIKKGKINDFCVNNFVNNSFSSRIKVVFFFKFITHIFLEEKIIFKKLKLIFLQEQITD